MPANVTALIMRTEPGSELSCQAPEYDFVSGDITTRHGVLSYFAAAALREATSFQSWLALIDKKSKAFIALNKMPELYQPAMQVLGDAGQPLPGMNLVA